MPRPLKAERDAVVAALSEPAETAEQAADRVITALDEIRASRTYYVLRMQHPDTSYGVGPFRDANQAFRAARKIAPHEDEDHLRRCVARLRPATFWTTGVVDDKPVGKCPECGHPTGAHDWPKYSKPGCVVSLKPRGPLGENICPCKGNGKPL